MLRQVPEYISANSGHFDYYLFIFYYYFSDCTLSAVRRPHPRFTESRNLGPFFFRALRIQVNSASLMR